MVPVSCWKIIKGKEYILVFFKTIHCLFILVFIGIYKVIIGFKCIFFGLCHIHLFYMCFGFGFGLYAFGHFIQYISGLMNPAALLSCLGIYFSQGTPETHGSVSYCKAGAHLKSSALKIKEHLFPTYGTFPVTVTYC